MPPISLVIPILNEEESIDDLIESINRQTLQPDEVILVDGGSTDRTIELVERLGKENPKIRLVKTDKATPGKGRNIGIEAARNERIALTDAGIRLDEIWLEQLVIAADESVADIVYGNYTAVVDSIFEKCAVITYVPAKAANEIRGKSIASCLLKKEVWKRAGRFPDLRAAEDLMFMEAVEKAGFRSVFAPKAMAHWQLKPDLASTFSKFVLYSKHNVLAGRQWDWHYGIVRQYLAVLPFAILGLFYSWWWLLIIPLWLGLRAAKRIYTNRFEFGSASLLNPVVVLGVMLLLLVIDLATFTGWAQAVFSNKSGNS